MVLDKRVIAIQMRPKAYDEIQRLKGEETWTRFIIECVLAKVGDNSILQDELKSLVKEPKEQKPKAEKPKREKKAAKSEKVQKTEAETPHPEAEPTDLKAIEVEAPTRERAESMGISTPVNKEEG